jgi:hypothetical protein
MNDILKTSQSDTGYVYIDTCLTYDGVWETIVCECDEDGNVSNWGVLDQRTYASNEEADNGHFEVVEEWRDE